MKQKNLVNVDSKGLAFTRSLNVWQSRKSYFIQKLELSAKKEDPYRNFNHIHCSNKGSTRIDLIRKLLAKSLAADFKIQENEYISKLKPLSRKYKAGPISENIGNVRVTIK